jgi:hypothetical protein
MKGEIEAGKTNNMAQTAVEWLVEQIESKKYQKAYGDTYISVDLMAKAKEMEKHQIMSAYDLGNQNQYNKICIINYVNIDEEQYYNETYNK